MLDSEFSNRRSNNTSSSSSVQTPFRLRLNGIYVDGSGAVVTILQKSAMSASSKKQLYIGDNGKVYIETGSLHQPYHGSNSAGNLFDEIVGLT